MTSDAGTATPNGRAGVHLVVCCHGLWGEPAHLSYLTKSLIKRWGGELSPRSAPETEAPNKSDGPANGKPASKPAATASPSGTRAQSQQQLVVLNTASNAGVQTYDGIDWCAERVVAEIHKEIERLSNDERTVNSFSMVGYSLGGLIARYTVGLLYSRKFFENVKPASFTTFATPHIGVSPSGGLFSTLSAAVGSRSLGRTGIQLYGRDKGWHADHAATNDGKRVKTPLLEAMSKPESSFLRGLSSFEHVDFYANATSDWVVPIRSGALMEADPWKGWPEGGELDLAGQGVQLDFLAKYPAIVTAIRIPENAPKAKSLPVRILTTIIPRRLPWLLNPYRVPWRFPLNWIAVIFSPIVIPLFFCLVIYKLQSGSRSSNKRVKQIEREWMKSKGGLQDDNVIYGQEQERNRMQEVLNDTIQGVAEDHVEMPEAPRNANENGTPPQVKPRTASSPSALNLTPSAREYLAKKEPALTPMQHSIQQSLNSLTGLRKHLVFFDNVMNSHAIIICRTPSIEVHGRGKVVVKHWVDHFQV